MKLKILTVILIELVQFINSSWWYLGLKVNESGGVNDRRLNSEYLNNQTRDDDKNFSGQNLFELSKLRIRSYENNVGLRKYCPNVRIFESSTQRRICFRHEKLLDVIARAAKLAIDECQHQFRFSRWNCSVFNRVSVFGSLTRTTSREAAFIYAINSAAAMYQITKACTRGELRGCSCTSRRLEYNRGNKPNSQNMGRYEWGGCSDNVVFGHKLSKLFVDSKENAAIRSRSLQVESKLINMHNNEVGRRTILKNMKQVCKCHGVSGSCSVKVCWKVMPDFREIGNKLVEKYRQAAKFQDPSPRIRIKKLKMLVSRRSASTAADYSLKDDLLFYDRSPNYCYKSHRLDTPGTIGRVCGLVKHDDLLHGRDNSSTIVSNCRYLCCGRGFRVEIRETEENCDCQFQWCCSVKCKKCKKKQIEYVCN